MPSRICSTSPTLEKLHLKDLPKNRGAGKHKRTSDVSLVTMLPLTRICIRNCPRILQISSILHTSPLASIPLYSSPHSARQKSGKRKKKPPAGVTYLEKEA